MDLSKQCGNFEMLELGWSVWSRHSLRLIINGLASWIWEFKMKFEVKREILKHDALKKFKCQWPLVGVGENVFTLALGWRSRQMYMVWSNYSVTPSLVKVYKTTHTNFCMELHINNWYSSLQIEIWILSKLSLLKSYQQNTQTH
jgi:hypothetical protein